MSSSDSIDLTETNSVLNTQDIVEVVKIDKEYSSISFADSTGIVAIDISENSAAGRAYSNIQIFKMKNQRFLITANVNSVYSAAQIKDKIQKSKNRATPRQILNYYGIDEKDYFFHNASGMAEPILIFRNQKLISKYQSKIKIDCPNYVIISES